MIDGGGAREEEEGGQGCKSVGEELAYKLCREYPLVSYKVNCSTLCFRI